MSLPDFIEYVAPDASDWRIERGSELAKAFDLLGPEVERAAKFMEWHGAMCTIGKEWTVVCRLYGVHPLFGTCDADELEPWTVGTLAEKLALPDRMVEDMEAAARTFWRRWKLQNRVARGAGGSQEDESVAEVLTDEEIEKLLSQQGFTHLRSPEQRRYAATRIRDLTDLLDNDSVRAVARGMIQNELHLFFAIDPRISALERTIEEREQNKQTVTTENDQLMKLLSRRADMQAGIQVTLKSLGLSEMQTGSTRRKGAFQDSVSGMIEAIKAYHAREDTTLVDGIFAAAEVEILTSEFDLRRQQYRPDLALIAPAAIEGMFDPNFKMPKIGQKAHRRLLFGFRQGLALARAEDGEEIVDLDEEAKTDAAVENAEAGVLPAGMEALVARALGPEGGGPRADGRGPMTEDRGQTEGADE